MKTDEIKILEKLGREVAGELGPADSPERMQSQRRAVQSLAGRQGQGRGRRKLIIAAGATLAWGSLLFVLLITLLPPGMSFWVGDQTESGSDGELLQAPEENKLPVRFSDGTRVVWQEKAEGRIYTSDRKRIRIVLGRGRILARVAKTTRSRWTVEAGPYRVTALGTDFTVSWSYEQRQLEVQVRSGRVEVKGPDVEPEGVVLNPGDHLRLTREDGRLAMQLDRPAPKPEPIREEKTEPPPDPDIAAAIRRHPRVESKQPEPEPVQGDKVASLDKHQPESWQELYDLGRYAEAVKDAEKQGLGKLLQRLDDTQLWQLADSARFASRGDVARKALIALRSRFRRSRRARIAAFILGRVAAEVDRNSREACRWFKIYLSESPEGDLAEEALGRSMQTCHQAGMPADALRAAKVYLKRYPRGVFREQAESLLKGERKR